MTYSEAYELQRVIRQTAYEIGRLGLRLGRELTLTGAVPQEESDQLRADQELAYAALERHLRALTRLAARDAELTADVSCPIDEYEQGACTCGHPDCGAC